MLTHLLEMVWKYPALGSNSWKKKATYLVDLERKDNSTCYTSFLTEKTKPDCGGKTLLLLISLLMETIKRLLFKFKFPLAESFIHV